MTNDRKTHAIYWFTTVVALAFTGIVAAQNKDLTERIANTRSGLLSGSAEAQPGDLVPSFEATDLAGETATIAYSNPDENKDQKPNHRLFFIYSNGCGVCVRQKDIWSTLKHELSPHESSLELTALHLPDALSAIDSDVDLEPLLMPGLSIQRAYRVTAVPLMLFVSPAGEVQWVHYGLLGQEKHSELIDFVDTTLG